MTKSEIDYVYGYFRWGFTWGVRLGVRLGILLERHPLRSVKILVGGLQGDPLVSQTRLVISQ